MHPRSIAVIDSLAPNAVDRDEACVTQERELGRNARLRDAKPGDEVADGGRAFEEDGEEAQTRLVSQRSRELGERLHFIHLDFWICACMHLYFRIDENTSEKNLSQGRSSDDEGDHAAHVPDGLGT